MTPHHMELPISALRVRALTQLSTCVFVGRAPVSTSGELAFFWRAYLTAPELGSQHHCTDATAYYAFGKTQLKAQRHATWSLYAVALRMLAANAVFDDHVRVVSVASGLRTCCVLGAPVHLDISEPSEFRLGLGPWEYVDPDYSSAAKCVKHMSTFLSDGVSILLVCLQHWPWRKDPLLQYAS